MKSRSMSIMRIEAISGVRSNLSLNRTARRPLAAG
jgi:hypothetical protein